MARILLVLALLVSACSAFVTPANKAVAFTRTAPVSQMVPMPLESVSDLAMTSNQMLLATSASDFGGYIYPIAGIAILATVILFLSPPLKSP